MLIRSNTTCSWTNFGRPHEPKAIECQNVDNTVAFEHLVRIFDEALLGN